MKNKAASGSAALSISQQKVLQLVLRYVKRLGLAAGDKIAESSLAQHVGTSRSPIRVILEYMAQHGITRYDLNRGFFMAIDAVDIPAGLLRGVMEQDSPIYLRLAQARFEGRLPDSAKETELSKLLEASRADVHKALIRAEDEGWASRSTGYGWEFLPTVNTLEEYEDLYAVRVALEPACLLSPKFKPNLAELRQLRAEQMAIANADPSTLDPIELFENNAKLHATIVGWSGNLVAIQILKRLDRIRRLAEYRQATRPLPRKELALAHCGILDAIEAGDTLTAAALLKAHLDGARRKKVTPTAFGHPATA